jgi:hypothetical protein
MLDSWKFFRLLICRYLQSEFASDPTSRLENVTAWISEHDLPHRKSHGGGPDPAEAELEPPQPIDWISGAAARFSESTTTNCFV